MKSIEKDTRICFEMETKRRKANEKKNGSTTKTSFNEVEMWFRGRCAFINFPQTPPND